jgi:hypothetical protein
MTDEEIQKHKDDIDKMDREAMCRLWRFAPPGHPYFVTGTEVYEHFDKRFKELGGFSPEISKKIGLGQ